jgi:hypothetical protein
VPQVFTRPFRRTQVFCRCLFPTKSTEAGTADARLIAKPKLLASMIDMIAIANIVVFFILISLLEALNHCFGIKAFLGFF